MFITLPALLAREKYIMGIVYPLHANGYWYREDVALFMGGYLVKIAPGQAHH
ncbi:MAG: hypothetical protein ACRDC6_11560 [Shewanella sp.]